MPKGIYKRTDEFRQKMSKVRTGKHHSEETRRKISKAHKGKRCHWKGGRIKKDGRIFIKTYGHPYAPKDNYILYSRLTMEKILGRYLKPCEVIHHFNGVVDDDHPENLQLFPNQSAHMIFHHKIK